MKITIMLNFMIDKKREEKGRKKPVFLLFVVSVLIYILSYFIHD